VIYTQSNLAEPLHIEVIDASSGLLIPFFDVDTNVVFVAGKVLCTFKTYGVHYRWKICEQKTVEYTQISEKCFCASFISETFHVLQFSRLILIWLAGF